MSFGGGFYQYGYKLQLDEEGSTSESNRWVLYSYAENVDTRPLHTFYLLRSAQISKADFLQNALIEHELSLGQNPSDVTLHQKKISLLLRYDRTSTSGRSALTNALRALPDHWWPNLTLALAEVGAGRYEEGRKTLVAFVESHPSFLNYTHLASFYRLLDRPDEVAATAEKALLFLDVGREMNDTNLNAEGYALGVFLYEKNHFSTVIKLCDVLLLRKGGGDYGRHDLMLLREFAVFAISGEKLAFHPNKSLASCWDPYNDFPIRLLILP